MLDYLCKTHELIVTMEENVLRGGMGMCATRYIHEHYPHVRVLQVALPDAYVEHGNVSLLREMLGIDSDSVIKKIETGVPLHGGRGRQIKERYRDEGAFGCSAGKEEPGGVQGEGEGGHHGRHRLCGRAEGRQGGPDLRRRRQRSRCAEIH